MRGYLLSGSIVSWFALLVGVAFAASSDSKPIQLVILAGDELVLEQGLIDGRTDGVFDAFYPNAEKTAGESKKHVHCTVYAGAYVPDADYEKLTPVASALVEIGDQRTRQIQPGRRGREPVPYTPFPDLAMKADHTTVLRGWVDVPFTGHYEFRPGAGESAFNVTEVNGVEVYRREPGQAEPRLRAIHLEPGERHAFRTIFFGQPGHAFRLPLLDKPGALSTVVQNQPEFAFLKNPDGSWATREDVILFDAHPIHNNTESAGQPLSVGDVTYGGRRARGMIGVEQTLGHLLGEHHEAPVMLLRFGTHHELHFRRGSRSLSHHYMPPSSGSRIDEEAKWDVIHFNWGIWDMAYRDPQPGNPMHPCKYNGTLTTSLEEYEKNLRQLVARINQTGASLIWGSITPVHEDTPGRFKEDAPRYNAVAEKIMREFDVRINDLFAESLRLGYPKRPDVHSTGNLAPKVIEEIEAALAAHPNPGKPLPRVLLIGDSITGGYQQEVIQHFQGRANVFKNPGNAQHTRTGLKHIDTWLETDTYRLSGMEYSELVNGVKKVLADPDRYFPDYQGQPIELAGLVWFQGIADANTEHMGPEYAGHLQNLVHDLRRDLEAPELPAVVMALGWEAPHMAAVRAAQLSIADTVERSAAVDTRPFMPVPEASPGNRPEFYYQNAESFLRIGQAAGEQLLQLIRD